MNLRTNIHHWHWEKMLQKLLNDCKLKITIKVMQNDLQYGK